MSLQEVEKDIKIGVDCLHSPCPYTFPDGYGTIYVNTNENLSEYYRFFPIDGGNVLTVSSGGDQILQAVYYGAKRIDSFDKNKFAIYAAKLKIAAVKALSQKEFLNFYNYAKFRENFSFNLYKKIRDYLDEETAMFWDAMYKAGFISWHGYMTFLSSRFDRTAERYDEKDNFWMTKTLLENVEITYCHSDIYGVLDSIQSDLKYGAVFLSNIYDYLMGWGKKNYPRFIMKDLNSHLNPEARVAVYVPHHNEGFNYEKYIGQQELDRKVYVYERRG